MAKSTVNSDLAVIFSKLEDVNDRHNEFSDMLHKIYEQALKTNGRVNTLETKYNMVMAGAGVVFACMAFAIPIIVDLFKNAN